MLPESITAIVARNERWTGEAATEPFEAGWAREAVIFVRALKTAQGTSPVASIEISPDGMHWTDEGTRLQMPSAKDEIAAARLTCFGNWLRLSARFEENAECIVLVTIHLKA